MHTQIFVSYVLEIWCNDTQGTTNSKKILFDIIFVQFWYKKNLTNKKKLYCGKIGSDLFFFGGGFTAFFNIWMSSFDMICTNPTSNFCHILWYVIRFFLSGSVKYHRKDYPIFFTLPTIISKTFHLAYTWYDKTLVLCF